MDRTTEGTTQKETYNESASSKVAVTDDLNADVGRRIRKLRTDKSLSRASLSATTGMSKEAIRQVEKGVRGLSTHTIRELSLALGVTADYIIFGQDLTRTTILPFLLF